MKFHIRTLACAALVFLAACGGRQTMASKSARAFEKAGGRVERAPAHHHGLPGGEHAMHHDVAQHDEMQHDPIQHKAMKHSTKQHTTMQHDTMQHGVTEHATMHHDMPHDTGQPGNRVTGQPIEPEPTPTNPVEILRQDPFDAPSPKSMTEAKKKEQ